MHWIEDCLSSRKWVGTEMDIGATIKEVTHNIYVANIRNERSMGAIFASKIFSTHGEAKAWVERVVDVLYGD